MNELVKVIIARSKDCYFK